MSVSDNYEEELMVFRKILTEYPKRLKYHKEELHNLHQEGIDLLHVAELVNLNAKEGYQWYKDFQRNRQARRELKDEIRYLEPIVSCIQQKNIDTKSLNKLIGDIRNVKGALKNRGYRMKVRPDLQEIVDKRRIKEVQQ